MICMMGFGMVSVRCTMASQNNLFVSHSLREPQRLLLLYTSIAFYSCLSRRQELWRSGWDGLSLWPF